MKAFWKKYGEIVCKPLNNKGGENVFHVTPEDDNANAIFTYLTQHQSCAIIAQQYLPAIRAGDKRIILVNGEPIPYALTRIPQAGDWRGNLAMGAKGVVQPLSEQDRWICQTVGPSLYERGLYLVGLDVIGDYLTEINVTSPTGIRALDDARDLNISARLFDGLE